MTTSVAETRVEVLQAYKLISYVHEDNKPQIWKMICVGIPNLINTAEPREGVTALQTAAANNNAEMVSFLLAHGAQPNVQDLKGVTPLMCAAKLGYDTVFEILTKAGADMNVLDCEGKGVLFYCLSPTKHHMHCLEMAITNNADVNNISTNGIHIFVQACEDTDHLWPMCVSLMERGADPNATNEMTGRTALMEAIRSGPEDLGLVRGILQRGGDPNAADKRKMRAAHFGAEKGFFEVIQLLSAYSTDFNVISEKGDTPLHYAGQGGFAPCCKFLAQRGCDPKTKNHDGQLASQMAKEAGNKPALKELRKAEQLYTRLSKPGYVNPNEVWALKFHDWSVENEVRLRQAFEQPEAGQAGSDIVTLETFTSVLSGEGAPVDEERLQTIALAHTSYRDQITLTEFFKGTRYLQKAYVLTAYAPKKKKTKKGGKAKKAPKMPVFNMPICTIPPDLILRREDGGPPPNMIETFQLMTDTKRFTVDQPPQHPIVDDSGWYINEPEKIFRNINQCVRVHDIESLDQALRQKVPIDVVDRYYKTPLMAACASGSQGITDFLLHQGADVHTCDQFGWTPLHHACRAGQLDVIESLVNAGALVDVQSVSGTTPLMISIEASKPDCVDYLISSGANVQAVNINGKNCLDMAVAVGDLRVVELLQDKLATLPRVKEIEPPPETRSKPKPKSKGKAAATARRVSLIMSWVPKVMKEKEEEPVEESVTPHEKPLIGSSMKTGPISFTPKTPQVWGKQLHTLEQHTKKPQVRNYELLNVLTPMSESIKKP